MELGPCEYCTAKGPLRLSRKAGDDIDAHVCDACWRLLQNPVTAVPLLRGHVTLHLREKLPKSRVKPMTAAFVGQISKWRPRPKVS